MAEEGCGFYLGVFVVLTGTVIILGMGVYSIYNPIKVPKCGPLDALQDGEIVVSMAEEDELGFQINKTRAFFKCNIGYKLEGPEIKVCEDPDWKPEDPVKCTKLK